MQHESTQKLVGGDGHLALLAAVGIVFPAEGDLAVGNIQNPMIGDGDAVKCNAPGTEARAPALRTGVWHRPPNLDERGGGGKHERRSLWPEAEGCRGTRVRLAERRASSRRQICRERPGSVPSRARRTGSADGSSAGGRATDLRTGVWHRPPNLDERGGGGKHERRSLWPERTPF